MNKTAKTFFLAALTLTALAATACRKEPPAEEPFCDSLRLYAMGDYGSQYWRIPALLCLDDGTLLAVNDKRKYSHKDLPEDIDIVCRRSTDGGATWSAPATLAEGTGVKHGYGDAALVQCAGGDVVCVFVGGNGLWNSTAGDPISSYVIRSSDRGLTWSQPVDITASLWGSQALSPACRSYRASFFASGNGLRLRTGAHAGRILFAAAMCRGDQQKLDNFVVYSDDDGHKWQVSDMAFSGGDEAKLIELADGQVLISVRRQGPRGYNLSSDGGQSWGTQSTWPSVNANACNGDLLRIDDSTLLHSLPASLQRENVSLYASTDEGATWHLARTLVHGPSVYSSLTLLPDGTVAAYVEKGPDTACELWLYRFNTAWLRSGQEQ